MNPFTIFKSLGIGVICKYANAITLVFIARMLIKLLHLNYRQHHNAFVTQNETQLN